jgi:hypothetical protein
MRHLGALVIVCAAFALHTDAAAAAERRVSLGEVSTHVERSDVNVSQVLRTTGQKELEALDLGAVRGKDRVVVSLALVRMESDHAAATCVVSGTLRSARTGNVFAVVEGKAQAPKPQNNAEENALRGAIRGAMLRVPEALRGI